MILTRLCHVGSRHANIGVVGFVLTRAALCRP